MSARGEGDGLHHLISIPNKAALRRVGQQSSADFINNITEPCCVPERVAMVIVTDLLSL